MSSRLSGAVLALAAAALLAISIATSAWWSGHPVSPTRTYNQIAHVGLHGAKLCLVDSAELETCKDAPTHSVFGPVGYAELVACGLLVITSLALGVMTLRKSDERKTFALLVLGGAPLADALAVALIVIGPTSEATIPYGYGLYLFFTGSTVALVAAILARRALPALVLAPARQMPAPVPMPPSQQQPVVDMAALMRDDTMRPSSPEPMLGSRPGPPPSPGGTLAGPAGPLGAPTPPPDAAPLFQSAPQLRPLYEAQGTTPVAPPPKFPVRAPTPFPRDKIAAQMGLNTPKPGTIPPPFSRTLPAAAPPPIERKPAPPSKPPISRTLAASAPPPARANPEPPPLATPTPTPFAKQDATPTPAPIVRPTPTAGLTPVDVNPTDPNGFEAVGDATDVNVSARTPAPVIETPPPVLEAPATEEVPLSPPRGETNDDNVATIAREKISMSVIAAPEKPKIPVSTAPDSLPPPVEHKRAQSIGPSPACPQCEAPMAWVEEHLRFYCKSCRMYF